jgi:hypothetical protein
MTLAAFLFVLLLGSNAPRVDEWEFIPALLGEEPVWAWIWAPLNEHRMPLPRFVYYWLFQLTHDFRAGMVLQVVLLSALARGLMTLAAGLRGGPDWVDLFFPLSLLHFGHWENIIMSYQLCFVLFCSLVTAMVVVAVRTRRETVFRSGLLVSLLLLLAAMTGGAGIILIPPVGAWLVYLAVLLWRSGRTGRAAVLLAPVSLVAVYLGVYLALYEKPRDLTPSHDPLAVIMVTGEVLAMAPGVGTSGVWWLVAAVEGVIGVVSVVLLVRAGGDAAERPAATGLIAAAAGLAGVSLAVGISRASLGAEMGIWSRYSMLSWPLLAAAFLAWVKMGKRGVPMILCVASVLALPTNTISGLLAARAAHEINRQMESDSRAGDSAEDIVRNRFPDSMNGGQEERGIRDIPLLRVANVGIFGDHKPLDGLSWLIVACVAVMAAIGLGRWLWHLGKAVRTEHAREFFRLQHERFEHQIVAKAAETGLPRGLRWLSCRITGDALLVRDHSNGGIVALVPVVIQFEPIEGSDMVDVPAAREPRPATAVFTFSSGTWETSGKIVFNHTPEQTVAAYGPQFRVIQHGHH